MAKNPNSPDHFHNDSLVIQTTRVGLADIIQFMKSKPDLFPEKIVKQKRLLKRGQRMAIWQTWQAFLDHILILDSLGQEYESMVCS